MIPLEEISSEKWACELGITLQNAFPEINLV